MNSHPQNVVLTGGAGFIGSHVAEALLRRGAKLTIVDNLDAFYSPAWKKANLEEIRRAGDYEFANVDICAMEQMRAVMARARPEAIIHLAARAGVRPSIEQPILYERVNVSGTLTLLELCREFGARSSFSDRLVRSTGLPAGRPSRRTNLNCARSPRTEPRSLPAKRSATPMPICSSFR